MSRQASGLRAWVLQRVTAIYLLLFFPYLILTFAGSPPPDHDALIAWLTSPGVGVGLLLFVLSLLIHAWVGVRDVLIDYVRPPGARLTLLVLLGLALAACGLWALEIVLLARTA
jgi:succinate dehydrogenase / fumarate reductase membrane anchor subunit